MTGLSDGMAITPSCSWSSFFQLSNSALKVGVAGALERAADAVGAADAGRADAEPLQLGGGDLVANVERLGDERGLLELLLLDAGERAVLGEAAARRRRRSAAGSIFWPRERGLDQRLALLDHPGAGFGRCRKADERAPCGRVRSRAVA